MADTPQPAPTSPDPLVRDVQLLRHHQTQISELSQRIGRHIAAALHAGETRDHIAKRTGLCRETIRKYERRSYPHTQGETP